MSKILFSPEYYNLSAYYDEVVANLSWYQLNSDFKDPMYQYMNNLKNELYNKIKAPFILTNYLVIDDFVVNDQNETLQYGSYECSAPGKVAYMDSWFSCLLFQLPFFFEKIQLGYIGFGLILPIILISIFGGIKESYRWFILNQAIWDAFLCYDFICARPTLFGWSNVATFHQQNTCFYRDISGESGTFKYLVMQSFRIFLRNASFIPVFHLAFSRFICMYFSAFYKRFTKNGYKILICILLFNIICLTIFCGSFVTTLTSSYSSIQEAFKCNVFCPSPLNSTYCTQNVREYFQCFNRPFIEYANRERVQQKIARIFRYISYSVPPIMFLLSIICAGFLFSKIASQLQFQLKTNTESFKQTIKISSVVGFQCLTMSLICVITGIQKFMQIKTEIVGTRIIYDELPTWLFLLQNYTTTTSLNMIRILLDSCIILTVLSGYSKCIVLTIKFLWLCFTNPKRAYKKVISIVTNTKVTIIASSHK